MNLTEKVAVALLRAHHLRNTGRATDLTPEQILERVFVEFPDSYLAAMADARAAIKVVEAERAHDPAVCRVCREPVPDVIPPEEIPH